MRLFILCNPVIYRTGAENWMWRTHGGSYRAFFSLRLTSLRSVFAPAFAQPTARPVSAIARLWESIEPVCGKAIESQPQIAGKRLGYSTLVSRCRRIPEL